MSMTSRKRAAALVYDPKGGDAAPRVVAKGYGVLAEMIVARAHDAGLYVHTAPEMVSRPSFSTTGSSEMRMVTEAPWGS